MTKAAKYVRFAGAQGFADAQCLHGFCLPNGEDAAQNCEEPLRCFKLAVDQGHPDEEYNYDQLYLGQWDPLRGLEVNDRRRRKRSGINRRNGADSTKVFGGLHKVGVLGGGMFDVVIMIGDDNE